MDRYRAPFLNLLGFLGSLLVKADLARSKLPAVHSLGLFFVSFKQLDQRSICQSGDRSSVDQSIPDCYLSWSTNLQRSFD